LEEKESEIDSMRTAQATLQEQKAELVRNLDELREDLKHLDASKGQLDAKVFELSTDADGQASTLRGEEKLRASLQVPLLSSSSSLSSLSLSSLLSLP
jgi:peptidoglycan hydrolase CwlO-like protein